VKKIAESRRPVFDTGNFEAVHEHAEDHFDEFIGSTCHFHFKDFAPNVGSAGYHGTHFGQGMAKNREIAQCIKRAKYDGWVALESYPQAGNGPRETVAKELAVLKAML
jgi:L-ribulose-5-phosphate 3-epimerase UlaE